MSTDVRISRLSWLRHDCRCRYGGSTNATVPLYIDGLKALIGGPRGNHPCIVQWEPFNEGDMFDLFNNTHGQVSPPTETLFLLCFRACDWGWHTQR